MNAHNRAEEIEEAVDVDNAAVSQVEDGIREFVRNDIAYLRRPQVASPDTAPVDPNAEATVNNVNSLIQRVAGNSTVEIDNLIDQLQDMREFLQIEGERISREIAGYAQASQNARSQMEMIAEQIVQLRAGLQSVRAGIN